MASISDVFEKMPARHRAGVLAKARSYYFSIGDLKYTVQLTPETCTVQAGKTVENADCILKTTPELFESMVMQGKMPSPMDIMMGRLKTNDPAALNELRSLFEF